MSRRILWAFIAALPGCALPHAFNGSGRGWRLAHLEQRIIDPSVLPAHLKTCLRTEDASAGEQFALFSYRDMRHLRHLVLPLAPQAQPDPHGALWVHPGTCDAARTSPPANDADPSHLLPL